MCGYIFCNTNTFPLEKLTLQVSLRLRGPDQENLTQFTNFYFHHFRLQIVGSTYQGTQPVESDDYILLFNGEIYNFKELTCMYGLPDRAYTSDTLCLFELFHIVEPHDFNSFLSKVIGHYSFLLFSKKNEEIHFMRDQMGVKPLYFSKDLEMVSSDIYTVVSSLKTRASQELLLENIIFGGLTGERTIYPDIFTCQPGILYSYAYNTSHLTSQEIRISNDKYFNCQDVGELIHSSILNQVPQDIRFFTLVSSGIDSRLIKKIVAEISPSDSYTLGLGIYENLEKDLCTDDGTTQLLIENLMSPSDYYRQLMAYGEVPAHNNFFALSHIYSEINRLGSSDYKVALVGEGADEYFGGYGRYRALSSFLEGNTVDWISSLMKLSPDLWMLMMNTRLSHTNISFLFESGINIASIIEKRFSNLPYKFSSNSLNALSLYDQQTNLLYGLKKQDISSMLSSIEARTPYVIQSIHANSQQFLEINSRVTKKRLRDYALVNGIDQKEKIGFPVSISKIAQAFDGVYYDKTDQLNSMEVIYDLPPRSLSSHSNLETSFLIASLFL